jgi:hypothetical protein
MKKVLFLALVSSAFLLGCSADGPMTPQMAQVPDISAPGGNPPGGNPPGGGTGDICVVYDEEDDYGYCIDVSAYGQYASTMCTASGGTLSSSCPDDYYMAPSYY